LRFSEKRRRSLGFRGNKDHLDVKQCDEGGS
jgi:hypothetical protein